MEHGDLRIACDVPPFEWRGRPDGLAVIEVRALPDHASAIVLLDPPLEPGQVHNLVRVGSGSEILWHAELPGRAHSDFFVEFDLQADGSVFASTWSGWRVYLSRDSGKIQSIAFTK